jgi:predicted anti-sigma-YlaC factor YlaD
MSDGEDPGLDPALVDAHLARCGACRAYRDNLHELRRRSALRPAPRMPDLSATVVKQDRIADRASRWGIVRGLLVVVALEIIVLSLPALVLGEEQATGAHAARHLGAFAVAYGAALLVVAARPARARTVLPVASVLAVALAVTAVVDVIDGQIPLSGEALHVPELISVLLIWLLAIPAPRRRAGGAADAPPGPVMRLVRSRPDRETGRRAL